MKIVSPLGIVLAVLLTALVVGCSSGPGQAPDEEKPPEEMPETPDIPPTQVFSGTFVPAPDPMNPLTGTITATITGINQDGADLTGAQLAGLIAALGGPDQTFTYALSATLDMITLTGALLDAMLGPGASVTATRSGQVTDPMAALFGTWTYEMTDPITMVTSTLTLVTTAPNMFELTAAHALPASS